MSGTVRNLFDMLCAIEMYLELPVTCCMRAASAEMLLPLFPRSNVQPGAAYLATIGLLNCHIARSSPEAAAPPVV